VKKNKAIAKSATGENSDKREEVGETAANGK